VDWGGQPETATEEASFQTNTEEPPTFSDVPVFENAETSEALENDFSPAPHFETPTPTEESGTGSYDFSQPLDVGEPLVQEPINLDTSDLSDIADFGNADVTQSAFNYSMTIEGIDSGALRKQLQEALSDSKFNWNVIQVMAQIKGGVLTIKSINPVKASILMQRLKYLPVKVSWRQDVLSSTV
jgi:hypothetical protein